MKNKVENGIELSIISLIKDWKCFHQYIIEQDVSCEEFSRLINNQAPRKNYASFRRGYSPTGSKSRGRDYKGNGYDITES